jgi:hypothetical protein
MAVLYGRAGRLTAKNGGFRPGQWNYGLYVDSGAQDGASPNSMGLASFGLDIGVFRDIFTPI